MALSPAGEMVVSAWKRIPARFPNVELDEFIVMPNHFHAVVLLVERDKSIFTHETKTGAMDTDGSGTGCAGATTRVAPTADGSSDAPDIASQQRVRVGATLVVALGSNNLPPLTSTSTGQPENQPSPRLGDIVGAFKSISTLEYMAGVHRGEYPSFTGKLWQRNYYEHIVRDDLEWARIRAYIQTNPAHWAEDSENIDPHPRSPSTAL